MVPPNHLQNIFINFALIKSGLIGKIANNAYKRLYKRTASIVPRFQTLVLIQRTCQVALSGIHYVAGLVNLFSQQMDLENRKEKIFTKQRPY